MSLKFYFNKYKKCLILLENTAFFICAKNEVFPTLKSALFYYRKIKN
jgi:hypothetical protein